MPKKNKYIVLRPKYMRYDISDHLIHIGNTVLERIGNDSNEQSTKFLGMHIDN